MHLITVVGILAVILTELSLLPQVVKIVKTKKSRDISLIMTMMIATGASTWVVYGYLKDDKTIIVANVIVVLFAISLLVLKFKYDKK